MSAPRITAAARVQRLLAILQWAAGHPDGVPVDELCERFRLKQPDLVRELDLASMIGDGSAHYDEMPFEVFIEDGLVYVRLFSFRRPMRLTPAEGLALVAAADVLVDRERTGDAPGPLERALAKLAHLLGIEPGEAVDVDLDLDGGDVGTTLRQAIDQGRQVSFTYWTYGTDRVARRTVHPWAVHADGASWYLVAWAPDAEAQRTFRLDRMEDVVVEDAAVSVGRPKGLDVAIGVTDDAPRVVLDLAPDARWVVEAHPVVAAEAGPGEALRVTMAVTGPAWLEQLLLRLGPDAVVVELDDRLGPPDLAARAARRVLQRYEGAAGAEGAAR